MCIQKAQIWLWIKGKWILAPSVRRCSQSFSQSSFILPLYKPPHCGNALWPSYVFFKFWPREICLILAQNGLNCKVLIEMLDFSNVVLTLECISKLPHLSVGRGPTRRQESLHWLQFLLFWTKFHFSAMGYANLVNTLGKFWCFSGASWLAKTFQFCLHISCFDK